MITIKINEVLTKMHLDYKKFKQAMILKYKKYRQEIEYKK